MPRAGLSPESVAEAAAVIVDAEGSSTLTIARLAAGLGVAPPSLYKHVASLNDVILRVTTLAIRRLANDLAAAALGRSGREALSNIANAYRRYAIEHTGLYALTQTAIGLDSSEQQAEASRAVEVVRAAIRSYGVPDGLSIHAVRIVRAGLHGFADIEARGGFGMPYPIDESFLLLVDALDAALVDLGRRARSSVGAA